MGRAGSTIAGIRSAQQPSVSAIVVRRMMTSSILSALYTSTQMYLPVTIQVGLLQAQLFT